MINDAIMKSLNDWLLREDQTIEWRAFWDAQQARFGKSAEFRDYVTPRNDPASIFLRAYFRALDL